ncbi:MAG: YitT family protein [Clostridiaceae bacterium]|nr:YitT family protein [Clostridiaceae bacterium]
MHKGKIHKTNIIDIFFIMLGSFLSSIGVNLFLIHAGLLSGGVTGIALILQYLFKIQAGYVVLILNVPLFLLSLKKLNIKFSLYSLVGILTFSISLIVTQPISNILNINDKLLYCIYGGVVNGIGFGLVFSHRGSTGGFDIISMLIRKKFTNYNIGKISFGINLIIVTISAFIFGLPNALYTLITMFITSIVLDNIVKGFNQSKVVLIITEKEEEVVKLIMKKLNRGVTCLYGEGAFTKEQKKVLYCIIPLSQLPEIKELITNVDKMAFLSILDASEVQGKGFRPSI